MLKNRLIINLVIGAVYSPALLLLLAFGINGGTGKIISEVKVIMSLVTLICFLVPNLIISKTSGSKLEPIEIVWSIGAFICGMCLSYLFLVS